MGEEAEKNGENTGEKVGGKPGEERENRGKKGENGKKLGERGRTGKKQRKRGVADDFGVHLVLPHPGYFMDHAVQLQDLPVRYWGVVFPPRDSLSFWGSQPDALGV